MKLVLLRVELVDERLLTRRRRSRLVDLWGESTAQGGRGGTGGASVKDPTDVFFFGCRRSYPLSLDDWNAAEMNCSVHYSCK